MPWKYDKSAQQMILSPCFNGHFPGGLGLASFIGVKDDGSRAGATRLAKQQ